MTRRVLSDQAHARLVGPGVAAVDQQLPQRAEQGLAGLSGLQQTVIAHDHVHAEYATSSASHSSAAAGHIV
jgi:hypothetical protein